MLPLGDIGVCDLDGVHAVVVVAFFLPLRGFWENVRPFIPRLRVFFFFFLSGDYLAHTNSTLHARISSQWLSELRRPWPSVP